ncbi:hypothetical protein [Aeromicrobium sp.]|uniref:hypothetical protein n=1 Tax=Aeromicrobium sp. TaxID=1871063 RepID=UPI0035166DDE
MRSGDRAALRTQAVAYGAVVALTAVAGLAARGTAGLLGALLAGVVVAVFLGSTPVVLNPVARSSPVLSLPAAVLFFLVKAFAAMAVLFLLFDVGGVAGHVDRRVFGLAAVVCSLAWTALALWSFRRRRVLTYDLGDTPS